MMWRATSVWPYEEGRLKRLEGKGEKGRQATGAPVAESSYDPNCKILCSKDEGRGCVKLTGGVLRAET